MKKIIKYLIFFIIVIILIFVTAKIIYKTKYLNIIEAQCQIYNVDKFEILSIIKAESNFNADAISSKNAVGLMQLTPKTANWCANELGMMEITDKELLNPETNIKLGVFYYSYLKERYKDVNTALAAYNAGMGKVDNWLLDKKYSDDGKKISETPYEETNRYITKINNNLKIYKFLYKE